MNPAPLVRDKSSIEFKGLQNNTGENNCFLNGIIQTFYHLQSFRIPFNQNFHSCPFVRGELEENTNCVTCALKKVFDDYEYKDDAYIPASALRNILSNIHKHESRFKLNDMEDASEAYEEIVKNIHIMDRGNAEISICEPPCLIHHCFSTRYHENWECCGDDRNNVYDKFVQYIPAPQMFASGKKAYRASLFRARMNEDDLNVIASPRDIIPFDNLLSMLIQKIPEPRRCEKCNNLRDTEINITHCASVVVFGLVWENNHDDELLATVLELIHPVIDMHRIYPNSNIKSQHRVLQTVICYYGQHYVCLYYNALAKNWLIFDDANVKQVGHSWHEALIWMRKNKYSPHLLFYETCTEDFANQSRNDFILGFNQYLIEKVNLPRPKLRSKNSIVFHPSKEVIKEIGASQGNIASINESEVLAKQINLEQQEEERRKNIREGQDMAFAMQMQQEEDYKLRQGQARSPAPTYPAPHNPGGYPAHHNPGGYPAPHNPGVYPAPHNPGVYPAPHNPGVYPASQGPGSYPPHNNFGFPVPQNPAPHNPAPHNPAPFNPAPYGSSANVNSKRPNSSGNLLKGADNSLSPQPQRPHSTSNQSTPNGGRARSKSTNNPVISRKDNVLFGVVVDIKGVGLMSRWKTRYLVLGAEVMTLYRVEKGQTPDTHRNLMSGFQENLEKCNMTTEIVTKKNQKLCYLYLQNEKNRLAYTISLSDSNKMDLLVANFTNQGVRLTG